MNDTTTHITRKANTVSWSLLLMVAQMQCFAAIHVDPAEMTAKTQWVQARMLGQSNSIPFSFTYNGVQSASLLSQWPEKSTGRRIDSTRLEHTRLWTDPATGLEVKCVGVEYSDYPVAEWTVYFTNTGNTNTPILENVQGLDVNLQRAGAGEFALNYWNGSFMHGTDFQPFQAVLAPGTNLVLAPDGGRGSDKRWPYYNLLLPGGGIIMAVGWPGHWQSTFTRDSGTGLRMISGQGTTHLFLKPKETIRTPLMALLFWQGDDAVRSQNLWRRWYMAHVIPQVNGKPLAPMSQVQSCGNTEQELFDLTKAVLDMGIKLDLAWRDAGWYPCNGFWSHTGTWEVDTNMYPHGFKPFSDFLHAKGIKFLLWNEPERVDSRPLFPNWLCANHPEWILGGKLVNLGDPQALQWTINHFDNLIKTQGVDVYRQDFNMDPLNIWQTNDAPDRKGITENLHIQGYLAFWDELLKRNPGLLIDSCASGGRRLDLETMRRAAPYSRTDYVYQTAPGNNEFEASQGHTYGIASWLPFSGTCGWAADWNKSWYNARSDYSSLIGPNGTGDPVIGPKQFVEGSRVAACMGGDYYPLTPFSVYTNNSSWMAWQFDDPASSKGVVQVFRRPESDVSSMTFHLSGLNPDTLYEVTDADAGALGKISGRTLMTDGLNVKIGNAPGSAIIFYSVPETQLR